MKTHKMLLRRLTASLLCTGLLATALPVSVLAADPDTNLSEQAADGYTAEASGVDGGIKWEVKDKTLTISPIDGEAFNKGVMPDYSGNINNTPDDKKKMQPWRDSRYIIKKVIVEEGVTMMGNYAFDGMDSVEEYYFPWTIAGLEKWPIGVHSVKAFYIDENNATYSVKDNMLLADSSDGKYALIGYPCGDGKTELTLPEYIDTVMGGAFEQNGTLTTLTLPDSVEYFGDYMFEKSVLKSVTFGTGIWEIDEGAFTLAKSLESVTFPESVKSYLNIDAYAFKGTKLTSAVLPKGTKVLGKEVFSSISTLKYLKLPSTITSIGSKLVEGDSALDVLDLSEVPDTATFDPAWLTTTPALAYYSSSDIPGAKGTVIAITNGGKIEANPSLTSASLAAPKKEGYTFEGWYTEPTFENRYTEGTVPTAGTYYAKWSINSYTVSLDPNGGSLDTSTVTARYKDSVSLPTPSRTGYTFDGWYNGEQKVGSGFTVTENCALTAHWTANTYTISFDPNGGEGTMNPISATYDTPAPLPENAFTREGYTFAGWVAEADSENAAYADKASVTNLTSTAGETVTLYAVWTKNPDPVNPDPGPNPDPDPEPKPDPKPEPVVPIPDVPEPVPSLNGWKTITGGTAYYKNGVKLKGWQTIGSDTYYFDQKGFLQTGWLHLDGNWYRLDETTGARQTGWVKVGKAWYFMEENGVMKSATWLSDGGKWYYLGANGAMYSNQWRCTKGVWYYLLGNGEMAKNRWVEDNGAWYYLGSDGGMLTETITPDGYRVDADGKWIR